MCDDKNYECFRHQAQDIRSHTAAELKQDGAGSAANQRLIASLGRSSVHFASNLPPGSGSGPASLPGSIGNVNSPNLSVTHPGLPNSDSVEPLDFEDFLSHQQRSGSERDPLAHRLEFPRNDLDVQVVPKKIRTMGHILPDDEAKERLNPGVQSCVEVLTGDFVVFKRKSQHLSSSVRVRDASEERLKIIDSTQQQEFEVDDNDFEHVS